MKLRISGFPNTISAATLFLISIVLGGCATPSEVLQSGLRMTQEIDQSCQVVNDLYIPPSDANGVTEEIKARLRIRLTGMSCQIVKFDDHSGEVDIAIDNCPGGSRQVLDSIPVQLKQRVAELKAAINADRKTVQDTVSAKRAIWEKQVAELGDSISEINRTTSGIATTAIASPEYKDLVQSLTNLQLFYEHFRAGPIGVEVPAAWEQELDKSRNAAVKALAAVHESIETTQDALKQAFGSDNCKEGRTNCARRIIAALAGITDASNVQGVSKNLSVAFDALATAHGLVAGAIGDASIESYWRLLPDAGSSGVNAIIEKIERSIAAFARASANPETGKRLLASVNKAKRTINDMRGVFASSTPTFQSPSAQRALMDALQAAVATVRTGLQVNIKLAAGEVPDVVSEIFTEPVQYKLADRSLSLAERALAPADKLIERLDDRFYLLGSVALAWNEPAVQHQFDELFDQLRLADIGHPRLQLAFASVACRRLESTSSNSQFAPFLHRTLATSLPRGLCEAALNETGGKEHLRRNLRNACLSEGVEFRALQNVAPEDKPVKLVATEQSSCLSQLSKSSPQEWQRCLANRKAWLQNVARTVREYLVDVNKDFSDTTVMQLCTTTQGKSTGYSAEDAARVCGTQVAAALPRIPPSDAKIEPNAGESGVQTAAALEKAFQKAVATHSASTSREKPVSTPSSGTMKIIAETDEKSVPQEARKTGVLSSTELTDIANTERGLSLYAPGIKAAFTELSQNQNLPPPMATSSFTPDRPVTAPAVTVPPANDIPSLLNTANTLQRLCPELERRAASVRCYVQKDQLQIQIGSSFAKGQWNDQKIEEALTILGASLRSSGQAVQARVFAGASSSPLSCKTALNRLGPAAAQSSMTANTVHLKYQSSNGSQKESTDSVQNSRTSYDVKCIEATSGNAVLAFRRAAWSADLLERFSDGQVKVAAVGPWEHKASTGYDSSWDRGVLIDLLAR